MKSFGKPPVRSKCGLSPKNPCPSVGVHADGDGDGDEEDDDDYMTMTFDEAPAAPESSLQRRQREKREAERRSRVKSKAELAEEEEARREAALSRSLLDDGSARKSKGFAMMAKMGFKGGALGAKEKEEAAKPAVGNGNPGNNNGQHTKTDDHPTKTPGGQPGPMTEPIRVSIKDGREGIGLESDRKRKLREAAEQAGTAAKRARADQGEYRERMRREREDARHDSLVRAAQKVAERLDEEKTDRTEAGQRVSSRPLKAIPVVWRGLVRARETADRDRRMRHDLEQGLSRLPTYEADDLDTDDKVALGQDASGAARTVYATTGDLDDEDEELEAFEVLAAGERLARLVTYLREGHNYCFWCKLAYPDAAMDGCPGLTEDHHD